MLENTKKKVSWLFNDEKTWPLINEENYYFLEYFDWQLVKFGSEDYIIF